MAFFLFKLVGWIISYLSH
jgi:hypothetical protein